MYKWSRQQLLEMQAISNRETMLRNNQLLPVDNHSPSELSMFHFHPNLSFPPRIVSHSDSAMALTLQAKLDALKRQNQDAISKLLAQRQLDDVISPTDVLHRQAFAALTTTRSIPPERNSLLHQVSTPKTPCQDDMLQRLISQSDSFEKQKPQDTQDVDAKKMHQAVLEAEYSDPKPKRPLSAYNVFFQEQRQKILDNPNKVVKGAEKMDDDMSKPSSNDSLTATTVSTIHSDTDENPKKRKRYEPHHKMSFESMAKTIANRWKEVVSDEEKMRPYQEIAKVEKERYVRELAQWKQRRRQRLQHKC